MNYPDLIISFSGYLSNSGKNGSGQHTFSYCSGYRSGFTGNGAF